MKLSDSLQPIRDHFEARLKETAWQLYPDNHRLHEACRYALNGQGKRVRPLLVYLSRQAVGGSWQDADFAALAVEMVHTYSLAHDDLPSMDNDDWRRGRKTIHKVYDEATALLVGDALLTDALGLLATGDADANLARLMRELSHAIGGRGMILGQDLDLYWTDRSGYQKVDLDQIHTLKTGRLIAASCAMGAMTFTHDVQAIQQLREFGALLGLAFQIIDDILDDLPDTGKSQGKDRDQNKLTYLQIMSAGEAEEYAKALTSQAFARLESLGAAANGLRTLAEELLQRSH